PCRCQPRRARRRQPFRVTHFLTQNPMPTPAKLASLRKRLLVIAALVFIVLGLLYAVWWLLFASHYESTDDAYVHGNMVQVTPRIAGTIVGIEADDTQLVSKGSTLIKLDSVDTELALQQ